MVTNKLFLQKVFHVVLIYLWNSFAKSEQPCLFMLCFNTVKSGVLRTQQKLMLLFSAFITIH